MNEIKCNVLYLINKKVINWSFDALNIHGYILRQICEP